MRDIISTIRGHSIIKVISLHKYIIQVIMVVLLHMSQHLHESQEKSSKRKCSGVIHMHTEFDILPVSVKLGRFVRVTNVMSCARCRVYLQEGSCSTDVKGHHFQHKAHVTPFQN
jgi:hypothetical protein